MQTQIFCEDIDDYEVGEALRVDITENPLDIYMRVGWKGLWFVASKTDLGY